MKPLNGDCLELLTYIDDNSVGVSVLRFTLWTNKL